MLHRLWPWCPHGHTTNSIDNLFFHILCFTSRLCEDYGMTWQLTVLENIRLWYNMANASKFKSPHSGSISCGKIEIHVEVWENPKLGQKLVALSKLFHFFSMFPCFQKGELTELRVAIFYVIKQPCHIRIYLIFLSQFSVSNLEVDFWHPWFHIS